MKKILLLSLFATLLIGATSFESSAQSTVNGSLTVSDATLTNAQTITLTPTSSRSYFETLSISFLLTRNSGTLVGTATLQVSRDGTNWINTTSTVAITDAATFPVTFTVIGVAWNYYRVSLAMTSNPETSTVSLAGYTLKRR